HDKIGGILRFGIPEFRLPKKIIDRYQELLIQLGVKIRPNTIVGPVITLDDLFRDNYKAVFIGTGVWKPRKLDIEGESLGNVFYAIDYLRNPENHYLGQRVSVIGGGNVALDVARTALRKGAKEVVLFYRRSEKNMPSSQHEIDYAKMDGVQFEFNRAPKKITDSCVYFIKTKVDSDNNLIEIPGTEICYDADSVIISVSQKPQRNIVDSLESDNQIKLNKFGLIMIDNTGKTSMEGVFASGDVVSGAKTVVEAVASAKIAANTLDEYVKSQE
ncbi:MAG: FAD-dependent oxidoreductase, partial [Bacillota bacterium]|nr:FAD-dependent oxidoreductase [Bacillota bacterium]